MVHNQFIRNKLYPIDSFYMHWLHAWVEDNSKIPLSFLLRTSATFNCSRSPSSFHNRWGLSWSPERLFYAGWLTHLILLDLITVIIYFEEYKLWSFECEIFCVIILLSSSYVKCSLHHLFSHNLNLCKCLRAKDHIWKRTIQQIYVGVLQF